MEVTVDMQIACEDEEHPPPSEIQQWVEAALGVEAALAHVAQAPAQRTELTIRIVGEAEIRALNRDYRDRDTPTNVLSFSADLPHYIDAPLLGDLVICAPVVNREAREQHKYPQHHWAHMIIHGCLHLLGYDHIEEREADQMEALEVAILATLQIANPYLDTGNPSNTVNL